MAASAVEDPGQVPIATIEKPSNLGPIERGYLIRLVWAQKSEYPPLVCTLVHRSLFVVWSVTLVSIKKDVR